MCRSNHQNQDVSPVSPWIYKFEKLVVTKSLGRLYGLEALYKSSEHLPTWADLKYISEKPDPRAGVNIHILVQVCLQIPEFAISAANKYGCFQDYSSSAKHIGMELGIVRGTFGPDAIVPRSGRATKWLVILSGLWAIVGSNSHTPYSRAPISGRK